MANRTFKAFNNFFSLFGSAVAVSNAVENGRRPRASDLKKLGINADAFNRIDR